MTVIAWDGKTLAADKRMGTSSSLSVTKIRKAARNGHLIGASGMASTCAEVLNWYEAGADPNLLAERQRDSDKNYWLMIEITRDSRIMVYYNSPTPVVVEAPWCAVGCGQDFAMTAMYLGKTSVEAVGITNALTTECGNGVDALNLD